MERFVRLKGKDADMLGNDVFVKKPRADVVERQQPESRGWRRALIVDLDVFGVAIDWAGQDHVKGKEKPGKRKRIDQAQVLPQHAMGRIKVTEHHVRKGQRLKKAQDRSGWKQGA